MKTPLINNNGIFSTISQLLNQFKNGLQMIIFFKKKLKMTSNLFVFLLS